MEIQNQLSTTILQKFSSIKYIICISYYDHIIARLSKIWQLMVIQNQFPTIILQKFNSTKYIICISYYDYALQAWGRSVNWS